MEEDLRQGPNHKIVMHCLLGGPRNSSFVLCSRIQTTIPIKRKKAAVTIHMAGENGCKKAQAPVFSFLSGATTTSPEAVYGRVKSTSLVRLVTMAMSPTTASNFWYTDKN